MDAILSKPRKGLFYWRLKMSWFRHKPKSKHYTKSHPHTSSPMTEKVMQRIEEEAKKPIYENKTKSPNKD